MGFWSELGSLVVAVAEAVTGVDVIKEWLTLPTSQAESKIKYFIDTGSKADIERVYDGFVLMCSQNNDEELIKALLELFSIYVIYREQHRGRLYLSS